MEIEYLVDKNNQDHLFKLNRGAKAVEASRVLCRL